MICNLTERSILLLVFFKKCVFLPNHQIWISLRPAVFLILKVAFVGNDCKIGTMLLVKPKSASGISMLFLSSLRNNSNNAWSVVSNDTFDNLVCFLSLITFVISPIYTDSLLIKEGEFEVGFIRRSERTSTLTEADTRGVL